MNGNNLAAQKQVIRKNILARREALPADQRQVLSRTIIERIIAMPEYQRARMVLAYMNFGSEFGGALCAAQVLKDGKHLLLPRVNRASRELELYRVDNLETQLEQGSWGIAEPVPERCERLNQLNAVEFALLPGVAFARDGARLGYGGGFYDKLLARMKPHPVLVAAAFALQIVPEVAQEITDVKVDWIVTEHELIACSG
jgi:5-formyltetrahydrofolate cyclo-ligase